MEKGISIKTKAEDVANTFSLLYNKAIFDGFIDDKEYRKFFQEGQSASKKI